MIIEKNENYYNKEYFKCLNIYIIIFLIFFENHFYQNYYFCKMCVNQSLKSPQCYECPLGFIFKGLKIISKEKTLDEIIYNKKSITRFGDGEFRLIFGDKAGFQIYNKTLSERLLKILNCKEKNLLIGINIPYKKKDLEERSDASRRMWQKYFPHNKLKIAKIIDNNKKYYSALITRFYSTFKDKTNNLNYIKKFKQIWDKRDVLIIEGEKTRVGIGNDLLNNTRSIKRILCPIINAYNVYNKILSSALKFDKNVLILLALGPTATVLAYDLYRYNYQVIDIGHIDIEYELYLRKANHSMKIPFKYVFEAGGTKNIQNVTDVTYYNQIFDKILK